MVKLSVIIPTYKRNYTLLELIKRLQRQSFYDHTEVIIVNQNSENDLPSDHLDSHITVLYQKEPNVSSARNNGFKISKGNIVCFIDDDIYPMSDFLLESYYNFMMQNAEIEVLSPYLLREGEQNTDENRLIEIREKNLIDHASFFTISGGTFYKRQAFEKSGGFDPILFQFAKTAEDYELLIRMLKQNLKIHCYAKHTLLVNEDIAGGCELRTEDYWISREKCVKSWCLRVRIHELGKIGPASFYALSRSSFLNKEGLTSGYSFFVKQFSIFIKALSLSKDYYYNNIDYYQKNNALTHF